MGIFDHTILDTSEDAIFIFLQHQVFLVPVFLLFAEEAGIPLPAENVIFIYTGYQVAKGHISYVMAYLILLLAILLGSSVLYYLAFRYGQNLVLKVGKFIHLNEDKLAKVEQWFRKYGVWFIIFGRHIPGFRVPITVFSGMSEITYRTFILCVLVSDILTIPVYLSLGMKFGPKATQIIHAHYWFILLIVSLLLIAFGIYVFLRSKEKNKK